ncbi:hypothetical protein H8L32_10765 [Undibacterium sp. CY18W]|uniref:Uncharacterized protein n=1 Tax=Undibacterium hunanense TaxID=2762292 RepID=A0ABR6ZQ13_9BURK|nr:hypothetical protein [Undibacterium hunanense]MBC3917957.1 hypothetical protein [Undibacterium hunanense]
MATIATNKLAKVQNMIFTGLGVAMMILSEKKPGPFLGLSPFQARSFSRIPW